MQKSFYTFFTVLYIIIFIPLHAAGSSCSFNLKNASATISSNGVPLFVRNTVFKKSTLEKLNDRANKAKKKYANSGKTCPGLGEYVDSIVNKLLTSSQLDFIIDKKDGLEVVILCTKTKMPPVARVVAGKYLLVPASLPQRAKTEDALAAVLSHELAHYTLKHHARLIEELNGRFPSGDKSFLNRIKREHEKEADFTGLELMTKAGYNPAAAVAHLNHVKGLFDKMKKRKKRKGSHPAPDTRKVLLTNQIKNCKYPDVDKTVNSQQISHNKAPQKS
ncbi:MAG: hypothetical protein CME64_11370 [Halobacteriovoraceae bacterium]|nr:hypothetical protein [Halobacteriovoraceae bacterium]|tara:strand:- start:25144 stop:25971 length:828 start_codon:yes stop_codon:yes gene_type:complete